MVNPAFLLPLAILHAQGGPSLGERCNIGGLLDQVGSYVTDNIKLSTEKFKLFHNLKIQSIGLSLLWILKFESS